MDRSLFGLQEEDWGEVVKDLERRNRSDV